MNKEVLHRNVKPEIVVVDDFLENPDEIRALALQQTYAQMGSAGKRSIQRFYDMIDPTVFEDLLQRKLFSPWEKYEINGRFQFCVGQDPLVYHSDSQTHAGIIFLTPDAPVESGLSIVKSKKTGARRPPADPGVYNQTYDNNLLDKTKWETIDCVGNLYNRLVLWDGQLIHAPTTYFGTDINDSRLFWMFFFDAK